MPWLWATAPRSRTCAVLLVPPLLWWLPNRRANEPGRMDDEVGDQQFAEMIWYAAFPFWIGIQPTRIGICYDSWNPGNAGFWKMPMCHRASQSECLYASDGDRNKFFIKLERCTSLTTSLWRKNNWEDDQTTVEIFQSLPGKERWARHTMNAPIRGLILGPPFPEPLHWSKAIVVLQSSERHPLACFWLRLWFPKRTGEPSTNCSMIISLEQDDLV